MRYALLALAAAALLGAAFFIPGSMVSAPLFTPEPMSLRVLFVADIMLDRNVARTAEEEGAGVLFAGVMSLFADADVRIGNLEGTITNNPSIARRDNKILRFTFEPAMAAEILTPLRFDALSLANNHALDFYAAGYTATRERLEALGVKPFGHPLNVAGTLSTVIEAEGKTLCLVGYHSLFDADTASVVAEIQALRPNCWRLVVLPHWGEEYIPTSNTTQQEAAHAFVDAGADLVVGSHPHVVQEVETYKGKAIFYSLGNFMFDQNFSWETMHGLAVVVDFREAETRFTLIPTTVSQQKAGITEGEDRLRTLKTATVADFVLP